MTDFLFVVALFLIIIGLIVIIVLIVASKNSEIRKLKVLINDLEMELEESMQKSHTKETYSRGAIYDFGFENKKIAREFLYPKKDLEDTGSIFYRKKVVISGDYENFIYRDEIAELLWNAGADIDTAVSERTNFLIIGTNYGWKKMETAQEYGIVVIKEAEFIKHFPDYKSPYL